MYDPAPPSLSAEQQHRDRIGIIVAVREEWQAILRRMPQADRESVGGICFHCGALGGRPVVLAKSGMGAERARRLTRALLERYAPRALLIAGFGASLRHEIAPGDLVLPDEVEDVSTPQRNAQKIHACHPDSRLRLLACSIAMSGAPVHSGILVTMPGIATPTEKHMIASWNRRLAALDNETAGAAAEAEAAGVPWLAVRAITDGPDDEFPFDFARFTNPATGETNRLRVLLATLVRPWKIPALIRLGRRSSLAAGNLAAFIEMLLRVMGDEGH
jgi:adenosylhomocysteine nucleosidase